MIIVEHGKETQLTHTQRSINSLSNKEKKLCPRCGKPGSGPYSRWVRNSRGKRYEPYQYFAHREDGRIHWCYLGKLLDNTHSAANQLSNPKEAS
jgi:hypothetical protein